MFGTANAPTHADDAGKADGITEGRRQEALLKAGASQNAIHTSVDGPFDFIVSTWTLSHLDATSEAVRGAPAKLAPGGTAVFRRSQSE